MANTRSKPNYTTKSKSKSANLLHEYGNCSSIHGLSYILGNVGSACDRLLWLVIFLGAGCLAVLLTIQSFHNWQEHQVITTLKDMDKPIDGMDFPAVTVCANGLHRDLVERVLETNFEDWKLRKKDNEDKSLDQYMLEIFQIEDENVNVLDIIDTIVAPSDESTEANFVMQNQLACRKNTRAKRQTGKLKILLKLAPTTVCLWIFKGL
jgi:hypothetical protein